MKAFVAAAAALAICPLAFAAQPDWFHENTVHSDGSQLTVVCAGSGPSKELAYRTALDSCRGIATDYLIQSFSVSSLSISTERSAVFHEEVRSDLTVSGLQCHSEREADQSGPGDSMLVYLECAFDTSKTKVVPKATLPELPRKMTSTHRTVVVYSVPTCDDVLVVGRSTRSVPCGGGPAAVAYGPGDRELVVRARGRLPKHVDLSGVTTDTLEVDLEMP